MSAGKDVFDMKDDQILELVESDFKSSADDRREKNWQNYLYDKVFRAIDFDKPISPAIGDNNLGLGTTTVLSEETGAPQTVRSQIYIPYARSLVLTAKNMLCQAIWPNNTDFFSVQPELKGDTRGTEAFKAYAHYDMRRAGYQDAAEMAVERALVHDFQLFMVGWEVDYMWAPHISKLFNRAVTEDGRTIAIGQPTGRKIEYRWLPGAKSGTAFYTPSTYNVRHDPMAVDGPISPATCEWVGIETKVSWRRLLDMGKAGELKLSKVRQAKKEGGDVTTTEADFDAMVRADLKLAADRKGQSYNPDGPKTEDTSHALVRDRWDWTTRTTVINNKWVVRKERSVGIPFVKLVCHPVHGQFGGIPMIADLVHIQIEVNTMTRLRRDAQNNSVNKTMMVNDDAFQNPEDADQIRLNALEIIHVHPPPGRTIQDTVGWVAPPDPGVHTIEEQNNLLQFGERISAISATSQGLIEKTGRRTATEHELASAGTVRATGFSARKLERAIVSEVVQLMLIQYNLRLTQEQKFRVTGPKGIEWRKVHPSDFYFGVLPEIIPTGLSGEQTRSLELDLFFRGIKFASEIPPFAQMSEWSAIYREMWSKLKVPDADRFIKATGTFGADLPQSMENILMASGHYVAPLPTQDSDTHIAEVQQFATTPEFATIAPENKSLFVRHMREHELMLAQKEAPQLGQQAGPPAPGGTPGPQATPDSMGEQMAQMNRRVAAGFSGG